MLKEEFRSDVNWFEDKIIRLDAGFQGVEKKYLCKKLYLPQKKPKNQELSLQAKANNRDLASKRIVVEHAIGGMKRYRILTDRLRLRKRFIYDDVIAVCAGLWNLCLTY